MRALQESECWYPEPILVPDKKNKWKPVEVGTVPLLYKETAFKRLSGRFTHSVIDAAIHRHCSANRLKWDPYLSGWNQTAAWHDWEDRQLEISVHTASLASVDFQDIKRLEPQPPSPEPDGPVSPNGFRCNGHVHGGMPKQSYAAVEFVYSQQDRKASFIDLGWPVSGDNEKAATENQAAYIRKTANRFFLKKTIPYHVSVDIKRGFISVENGLPKPSGPRSTTNKPRRRSR